MLRHAMRAIVVAVSFASPSQAAGISGDYLESRTCDIYTGPCFANAQTSLAGHEALMAWSIDQGEFRGVALDGLKVVMALVASDTLGDVALAAKAGPIRSVILVDERASGEQREALAAFACEQAGELAGRVVRVTASPITMSVDHVDMAASLAAGDEVCLATRKLAKGDCVCSNEIIYYPPLVNVDNSAPAYTLDGGFNGRGLGTQWANPQTRSAFLATFAK